MDERSVQFVGLDVGAALALAGFWTEPAGGPTGPAEAAWPVRARMEGLRVTAVPGVSEMQRLIRELWTQHGGRPGRCTLVKMGWTSAEQAADTAAGLGLRTVIEPQRRFVLWSEGVLPAREVKDYTRPLPQIDAHDLERLRMTFAELMEQAAEDVQVRVLDQDDAVLDRYIDARYAGATDVLTVPVESLTDTTRLLSPFHTILADTFTTETQRPGGEHAPVEIVAARLRCIVLG